ncbi:hypothetical protein IJ118_01495 [Candidatus Saccharibacteria bacterium]|nr:hypothetical protein [Candidatus Saccharibacteria bacterium]
MKITKMNSFSIVTMSFAVLVVTLVGLLFPSPVFASLGSGYIDVNNKMCLAEHVWCNTDALPGFFLDESRGTITLDNYSGPQIKINGLNNDNITFYLKGDNTIFIQDNSNCGIEVLNRSGASTSYSGLYSANSSIKTTITGDDDASLSIVGNGPNHSNSSYPDLGNSLLGIFSVGPITIQDNITLNIDLMKKSSSPRNSYGVASLNKVTLSNPSISIVTDAEDSNDSTVSYGLLANSVALGDDTEITFNLTDAIGLNIPLKTNRTELNASKALVRMNNDRIMIEAREYADKVFTTWEINGLDGVDNTKRIVQYSSHTAGNISVKPIYEDRGQIEPEQNVLTILSMGVEGEYEPGIEATFRDYIETEEIADGRAFIIRIDANLIDFTSIELDNIPLDARDYELNNGSVIVRLNPSYLSSLANGNHIVDVLFVNGFARGVFSIIQSEPIIEPTPEDEDNSQSSSQSNNPQLSQDEQSNNDSGHPKTPETGRNAAKDSLDVAHSALIILLSISAITIVFFVKLKSKHHK